MKKQTKANIFGWCKFRNYNWKDWICFGFGFILFCCMILGYFVAGYSIIKSEANLNLKIIEIGLLSLFYYLIFESGKSKEIK